MPRIKTKTVKTTLNFHPNLPDNTVEVGLGFWSDTKEFYVSIWGADDTCLQSEALTYAQADELYNSIEKVTMKEANLFKGSKENNGFPSQYVF
jgi:hypothetical protein